MSIFLEISIILAIAAGISAIVRLFKQPLIIGYILSGLLVGPYFLNLLGSQETIEIFSQIGIALLLFIVGLNLSPKVIKEVGKVAVVTGVGQVAFTSTLGFLLALAFGFSHLESAYIAVALTFSSTIIILKLLSDKRDLHQLYGKISVGFLLVQDIIATFILILISVVSTEGYLVNVLSQILLKGVFISGILVIAGLYILPRLTLFFAKSQEFLFLFSIAYGLGLASIFNSLGFSIEIGALVAGVTLSLFPYHNEIASKMRPLRDFFVIIFFIYLGSQLHVGSLGNLVLPAIILSFFVLIGNPIIVMILMGFLGYKKKIGFLAGLTVAQISEFSLILIALGVKLGHLNESILSLVTIVGLVTIAGSSYLIMYSHKIYPYISGLLTVFERKKLKTHKYTHEKYDVVLFGYNRIGYDFLKVFKDLKIKSLIVDFNPDAINELIKEGANCKYGDADDIEFLEELGFENMKMIISTIPSFETNWLLTKRVRRLNESAIIIMLSHDMNEAYKLYEVGASYVVIPHLLGGNYASKMIRKHKFSAKEFKTERNRHLKCLNRRKMLGHDPFTKH